MKDDVLRDGRLRKDCLFLVVGLFLGGTLSLLNSRNLSLSGGNNPTWSVWSRTGDSQIRRPDYRPDWSGTLNAAPDWTKGVIDFDKAILEVRQ